MTVLHPISLLTSPARHSKGPSQNPLHHRPHLHLNVTWIKSKPIKTQITPQNTWTIYSPRLVVATARSLHVYISYSPIILSIWHCSSPNFLTPTQGLCPPPSRDLGDVNPAIDAICSGWCFPRILLLLLVLYLPICSSVLSVPALVPHPSFVVVCLPIEAPCTVYCPSCPL